MYDKEVNQPSSLRTCSLALLGATVAVVALSAASTHAESGSRAPGVQDFDRQMHPILGSYLKIGDTLAADSVDGVRSEAKRIAERTPKLDPKGVTGEHEAHYKDIPAKLKAAAQTLSRAKTLEEARDAYKKLSMPMGMWASMSQPAGIDVVYCPMAKASWLQKQGAIRNPYHGVKMLRCGQVVKAD